VQYADGQEARLGDKVKMGRDTGVVVVSVDTGEFAEQFPEVAWGYLGSGILIAFKKYGLMHVQDTDEDLQLVSRAS
jgi:hypothetical protein